MLCCDLREPPEKQAEPDPDHRVCLKTAIELTLACVTRYRLPETTRHAHHLASAKKDDA